MANNFLQDLNCPQYVDFLDGMDSKSGSPFFDCDEYQTPQKGSPEKRSPSPAPERGLTEDVENKLMEKMTAALSFIESTPKLKKNVFREKLFAAKAPLTTVKPPEIKLLTKATTVQMLPARIRSKTVARLDRICTGKVNKVKDIKIKKSSSLTDLRTIKKHTLPKTPLCLKRTIDAKAKAKALKTTEELELEQITEFQKQLSKMLRQNEIAYRKLISKQIPPKVPEPKPETSEGNPNINADKNSRQVTMKKALKLDSIIDGNSNRGASSKAFISSTASSTKDFEKSKLPSVSSSITSEEGEKTLPLFARRTFQVNIGFHSGIFFCTSNKKNTVPKPFSFETRMKQKKLLSTVNDENSELSNSALNRDMSSCKENISPMKTKSDIKVQNVMNMKTLASKKTIDGSNKNIPRGSPLSENRNKNW